MRLNWRFGARQLTIGGWLTVVLYIMAAVICWDASGSTGITAQEWKVWRSIALVFGGLGISKQLNLLTAFTEFGRTAAHFGGWYHRRQIVQTEFVRGVVVSCAAITLTVIGWARAASLACWLAVIVTAVVLGFVLIRAVSIHRVDSFINRTAFGLRWNMVLEVGGISVVIVAASWACHLAAG
jgi:hypothetical protein